jgi:hypothetical protein
MARRQIEMPQRQLLGRTVAYKMCWLQVLKCVSEPPMARITDFVANGVVEDSTRATEADDTTAAFMDWVPLGPTRE